MMRLVLFLIVFSFHTLVAERVAAQDCPKGVRYDCEYGCFRHTDVDGDGYCDFSLLTKPKNSQGAESFSDENVTNENTNKGDIGKNSGEVGKNIKPEQTAAPKHKPIYDLISVSIATLLLYFTTMLLYYRKVIAKIHHRKLWNLILLITFLVSCLFGLFLIVQINYNVAMSAFRTVMYWHVEIGIAMTIVAIIHILWHITYFKKMFTRKW